MRIRPMTLDDVEVVNEITDDAFYTLDVATRPADWPTPERRDPARAELWKRRIRHLIANDGPGCWVAEAEDEDRARVGEVGVVGVVAALRRERFWGLSTYAVRPGIQARGVGKQLLDAALSYAEPGDVGYICSSHDPKAVRRYVMAGFRMHPTALLWGSARRDTIPARLGVREGTADDLPLLDDADRASRGAGHGVDHTLMFDQYRLVVIEEGDRFGYAYLYANGRPYTLAATDEDVAGRLLWEGLAATTEDNPIDVGYLTSRHTWAVDIGLRAGLELHNRGFLALRGMEPPVAYLPSGHFL